MWFVINLAIKTIKKFVFTHVVFQYKTTLFKKIMYLEFVTYLFVGAV